MNNKILTIGSIIACIILLVASLSPVVGYNSARSSVRNSPLFKIRISREIDTQSDRVICEYVGKGELMPFPTKDSKTILFQKIINKISKMDEKTFDWLVNTISNQIHLEENVNLRNHGELLSEFVQIRKNPEEFKAYAFNEKGILVSVEERWYPGCYILFVILTILEILCRLDPYPTMG